MDISNYFGLTFADVKNEVGLTFDNYIYYCIDGTHWTGSTYGTEIKTRIAKSMEKGLIKF
jgi:hypothetical protein